MNDQMSTSESIYERRAYQTRRVLTWRTALYGFLRSNRRESRRAEEVDGLFADWHHPWLFFLALGIMVLSCVDAFMTLQLIERGMVEVNPVMAMALGQSAATFAVSKIILTGVSILIMVFLARTYFMQVMRTGLLLTFFFSVYCCLVCYQFVNLLLVI